MTVENAISPYVGLRDVATGRYWGAFRC
jgi:hypothetical protein